MQDCAWRLMARPRKAVLEPAEGDAGAGEAVEAGMETRRAASG